MIGVEALFYVVPFLLASVVFGYYWGASTRTNKERQAAVRDRDSTLKVLATLLTATDQLTTDVTQYNTDLRGVGQKLDGLHVDGELAVFQQVLLKQVAAVLESNRRLEDDLQCTRVRVEEQAQEIDRARKEARTDPLSGIGNRAAFDERLQYRLAMFRRQRVPFVLVLCDVDHFKWINDGHGHQAGDLVVQGLGGLLKSCLREEDFAARYGGDEFAILLANVDLVHGARIVERLRTLVSGRNFDKGASTERLAVTLSIGMAASWEGASAEEILRRTDLALYRSKEAGRNNVHCYVNEKQLVPAPQMVAAITTSTGEATA
jgi:diguanylate cyclase